MSTTPPDGKPLRLDEILGRLPETPALGPMVDRLIGSSLPDPSRSWAASEELGTTGGRLVDLQAVEASVGELVEAEAQRLGRQFGRVAALARAFSTGAFGAAIHVLLEESGDLEAAGRAGEAGAWADAAVRIGLEIGAPRTAEALRRLARCARAEGRLSEAASGYEEAFRRARDLGRTEDAVVAATGRGNVAVDRGRWSVAERWYHRALGLLEAAEPDGDTATVDGLRWRLFQNLGITSRELGALDDSATWYERAESESDGLDDVAARIEVQNGIGQLELARGDVRSAEVRFRRALVVLGEHRAGADPVRVAVSVNLGAALLRQGRSLEAGDVARAAEAEALRGGFLGRLPEVYRLLARVAHVRGAADAFVFLDRALELVRTRGLPALEEASTLEAYAELRSATGETAVADEAREQAKQIRQALDALPPESTEKPDE
jgi:tetratricopeptide (TPR) repeat protein